MILHEHSRAHSVSREEFIFMSKMLLNQSFMQLDLPSEYLSSAEDDENALGELLERIKKRKNTFSKYYEINVAMIDRFLCAQKQFYSRNYARCLSQMNFVNIVN